MGRGWVDKGVRGRVPNRGADASQVMGQNGCAAMHLFIARPLFAIASRDQLT